MQAQQWFEASQWFCRYYGLNDHKESLLQGLPANASEQFNAALFTRALENKNCVVTQHRFSFRYLALAPLLILYKDSLWLIEHSDNERVVLRAIDSDHSVPLRIDDIIDFPIWAVSFDSMLDARAEEHFDAANKHWLRQAIDEVRPWYRDLLLGSFIVNLLALITPLFTMNVYDRVVPNAAFHTLWVLASGVFIVIVFDWLLRQSRTKMGDIAGKHIDKKVSAQLFAKVLGMQLEHRPQSSASFAKQVQEFDSVRDFFTSATLVSAIDLPFTLLFLALISYLGGWMVAIPLTLMILLLFAAYLIKDKLSEAVDESSKLATQRQTHLIENLNLLQQIKHHNAEAGSQRQWEQIIDAMSNWNVRSKYLSNSISHLLVSAQQLSSVLLIIAGVYQIFAGALSMGGLIAIVMLSGRASGSINQLAMLLLRYHQCKSAISSLENTMSLPQEKNQQAQVEGQFQGAIDIQSVSFAYPESEKKVLDNISLHIATGDKIALVGAAGSGKSTLLSLLARQYQSSNGQILYDAVDANLWPVMRLRASIGYMPQLPLLHFGTVISNVTMGLSSISKEDLTQAIDRSGMGYFVQQLSEGIDTPVGELGRNLSGGQRQSILLARTLINQPSLLVLDEPSSFMDQAMRQHVFAALAASKSTMVIATHDQTLLSLCDKAVVMDKGRIVSIKTLAKPQANVDPSAPLSKPSSSRRKTTVSVVDKAAVKDASVNKVQSSASPSSEDDAL